MTQKEYNEIRVSFKFALIAELNEQHRVTENVIARVLATVDDAVGNTLLDGTDPTVIVIGDPIDGITLHGPFDAHEDAIDWAERVNHNSGDLWWAAGIETPE